MPRVALVLEGGGARGAFQIGAVRALLERGYEFDVVVGSSIGAINGAAIAAGRFAELEEIYHSCDLSDFVAGDPETLEGLARGEFRSDVRSFLLGAVKQRGLDMSPLRSKMEALFAEDVLRAAQTRFGLTTVAVEGLIPRAVQIFLEDIPPGQLIDYVMASSTLPGFQPVQIDGAYMLDGGFYDNLPIGMLLNQYDGPIIAVRLNSVGIVRKAPDELLKRTTYICPSEDLGGLLDLQRDHVLHNIELGYLDTLKTLGELAGNRYYFSEIPSERFEHVPIPESACLILAGLLAVPEERATEDLIVKEIAQLLGMSETERGQSAMKRDMWMRLVEELAAEIGVERVKQIRFRELEETVAHHIAVLDQQENATTAAGILDVLPIPTLLAVLTPQGRKRLYIKLFQVLHDVYDQYKGDYYGAI